MDFSNYNEIVQQWIDGVLSNSNTDAELTLKYCNDIIDYGLKLDDPKLVGFGYFHIAQVYYSLNDGNQFFENISKSLYISNLFHSINSFRFLRLEPVFDVFIIS